MVQATIACLYFNDTVVCLFVCSVDITGDDTMMPDTGCAVQHQTVTENLKTCNPLFSSLEGNPFAQPEK